jgi:hypothetical protein
VRDQHRAQSAVQAAAVTAGGRRSTAVGSPRGLPNRGVPSAAVDSTPAVAGEGDEIDRCLRAPAAPHRTGVADHPEADAIGARRKDLPAIR